ncbi:hypothetical protein DH2020_018784 [Rehmannia glutinosa]|uniref:Uncharacterized protein n=1 Tax=Rehmannia glutinosa TaxID=99300 RepID=A0ABR0WJY7_REHGL
MRSPFSEIEIAEKQSKKQKISKTAESGGGGSGGGYFVCCELGEISSENGGESADVHKPSSTQHRYTYVAPINLKRLLNAILSMDRRLSGNIDALEQKMNALDQKVEIVLQMRPNEEENATGPFWRDEVYKRTLLCIILLFPLHDRCDVVYKRALTAPDEQVVDKGPPIVRNEQIDKGAPIVPVEVVEKETNVQKKKKIIGKLQKDGLEKSLTSGSWIDNVQVECAMHLLWQRDDSTLHTLFDGYLNGEFHVKGKSWKGMTHLYYPLCDARH